MENMSSIKQAKLFFPNCLSFSLVAHVLNRNALQLYRVVLLTGRFPIYYITYCIERSITQISEELLRASLLQLMRQGYKFKSRNQVHLRTLRGIRLKCKGLSSINWVFDPANGYWDLDSRSSRICMSRLGLSFLFTNIPQIPCYTD